MTQQLVVRPLPRNGAGDPVYEVTGGTSPHTVLLAATGPVCDCQDFRFRHRGCKHIGAVLDEQKAARAGTPPSKLAEAIARCWPIELQAEYALWRRLRRRRAA